MVRERLPQPARDRLDSAPSPDSPGKDALPPLRATGILASERRRVASKGRPYRTFLIDGFTVFVGRGDADNDFLTFEVAQPHDLWLHVAGGTPGSHVVVSNPDHIEIPREVVERAASAAAWYSKARNAAKVEVHVCRVADVSKPRGAPTGLVELSRWKSVRVRPETPGADAD